MTEKPKSLITILGIICILVALFVSAGFSIAHGMDFTAGDSNGRNINDFCFWLLSIGLISTLLGNMYETFLK